jgi:DNA polymerase-3 subunit alpha
MNFEHALSCRSDFSIGESSLQTPAIVTRAKELGYKSVALVDSMSVSGLPDLASAAKKAGVKPIIGCTLRVYDNPLDKSAKTKSGGAMHTLKVYVHNEDGLRQLYRALSLANDPEHFYYKSRLGFQEVLQIFRPGDVSVSTGDFHCIFHHPDYRARCMDLAQHFGTLWVEIVPVNTPLFDTLNLRACEVLTTPNTKALLTYPVLYPEGQADSADVLRAITSNNQMTDAWLQIPYVRDFELREPAMLLTRSKAVLARGDVPAYYVKEAIRNIGAFADQPWYAFEKKAPSLPRMADDEFATLVQQCKAGWARRFAAPVLGHVPAAAELMERYKPRLAYELGVLRDMGFSGYFLLVQEIVAWSKSQQIMVGPGRGSVGGSLVAYLMGITDVDPLRFDLLFERFINPERQDLPDADLDFMSTRRQEVIEHIEQTYGADHVAGISNYSTLGAASAMRDVSRVFGLELHEYAASKQVEKEHGVSASLEQSAQTVPDLAKFRDRHPNVWKHAVALEGCMRNLGRHAAGVVVAGEPVVHRAVVETRSGGRVTNWDKRTVEDWGLIKMDVLGLSTLDTLYLCQQYVKERHHKNLDFLRLPLDNEQVLRAFGRGETVGVFQYESSGMRKLLMELAQGGTLTFDDLVAVTALFRPGPLDAGLCDEYVQIRTGQKSPYYGHPNMEAALAPTLGVIIYQEQVMQICRDVAGFTMAESDHVRKAMGKKDREKMASYREQFVAGAQSVSGMGEYQAGSLWDQIEVFAGYAFNKSHSVEYAIISWWAMWAKVMYPAEFYAASMSVVDDDSKLASLVLDAKRVGIEVLPPDINASSDRIEIRGERELLAPFQAVKGVSVKSAAAILQLRQLAGGKFTGLAHLEALVAAHKMGTGCNKTHRERLQLVGAFHTVEGGLPPLHPERLKDRLELMPGFTVDVVKADRKIHNDAPVVTSLIRIMSDAKACDSCSLKNQPHVDPRMGRTPRFMAVFDAPSWQEEKAGKMLEGESADYFKAALKDAGLSPNDGYYTALVKASKPKGAKTLTTEQVNGCTGFLQREIDTLKPPVIVAMGSAAIKHFMPNYKGNPNDLIGKVVFDPRRDASIVLGLNPGQVYHDASKIVLLQAVAARIADLVL